MFMERFNADPAPATFYVNAVLVYNGSQAQFNAIFAKFLAIPTLYSTAAPSSYYDLNQLLAAGGFERTNGNVVSIRSKMYLHISQGLFLLIVWWNGTISRQRSVSQGISGVAEF